MFKITLNRKDYCIISKTLAYNWSLFPVWFLITILKINFKIVIKKICRKYNYKILMISIVYYMLNMKNSQNYIKMRITIGNGCYDYLRQI